MKLTGRHFLTLLDYTAAEIAHLLDFAASLKQEKRKGVRPLRLQGKNIALIFEKTSTRTRCALEVATLDEGGGVSFLPSTQMQMGQKESTEDTAKVLGRYYDAIAFRGSQQATVQCLADHAGVPVWNALTDTYHPTQILADLLTIQEQVQKPFEQIKFVYVGDARNNMGNSLMIGMAKMGMHFVGLAPDTLFPEKALVAKARDVADQSGAEIDLTSDIDFAVKDADVIYTDVWVSMGEEEKFAERIQLLKSYQVNSAMLEKTGNRAVKFMHCLPAFHDLNTAVGQQVSKQYGLTAMEVTDDVFRSQHSIVFDQAENRMHTIKAIMLATLT